MKWIWLKTVWDTYKPDYKRTLEDEFKGMTLVFKKIPDFNKRKGEYVCGY